MTDRLGVFGGTFDPPHAGHLAAASAAAVAARLDRVLFVPAPRPWQKEWRDMTPAEDRYRMTQLAIEDRADFEVSRIELDRPGPTYTVDTLDELAGAGGELVLVLGADAAAGLPTWHEPERICRLAELAVVHRSDAAALPSLPGCRIIGVAMEPVDVSATDIRRRLRAGEPVRGLVPDAVAAYISERGLYADR